MTITKSTNSFQLFMNDVNNYIITQKINLDIYLLYDKQLFWASFMLTVAQYLASLFNISDMFSRDTKSAVVLSIAVLLKAKSQSGSPNRLLGRQWQSAYLQICITNLTG